MRKFRVLIWTKSILSKNPNLTFSEIQTWICGILAVIQGYGEIGVTDSVGDRKQNDIKRGDPAGKVLHIENVE